MDARNDLLEIKMKSLTKKMTINQVLRGNYCKPLQVGNLQKLCQKSVIQSLI